MRRSKTPRYTLIKGKYAIHNAEKPRQSPQPDGDTVKPLATAQGRAAVRSY